MLLLADRNFAVRDLIAQIAADGADLLIRCKNNRMLPQIGRLPDGSWLSMIGPVRIRVIDAEIVVSLGGKRHTGRYRLITTLLDHHRHPAPEIVALYHQRWEIETAFLELKSTTLGGIEQEVYALLAAYQALRLAMADATTNHPTLSPGQAGFTIALQTARDQIIHAAGIIAATTIDLVGKIGRAVLADPLPQRRPRTSPRVVKRAISKHRAKGTIDRTNYQTTTHITITQLTPDP
jgi:hypothetical protein